MDSGDYVVDLFPDFLFWQISVCLSIIIEGGTIKGKSLALLGTMLHP